MTVPEQFPRSAGYPIEWQKANHMGPNALWLTESLSEVMDLQPGMRVLDLGCGKAMSSIFLAKEFGLQVWAADLWIKPSENWERVREAGLADRIFPLSVEAHALPFADDFFDAVVSLDAYHYFGTDVHYLEHHLLRHLKPGGHVGIISPASPSPLAAPLTGYLSGYWYFLNSVEWWGQHWRRCPGLEVERCEVMPGGWESWLRWHEIAGDEGLPPESHWEHQDLISDGGRHLGFVRMVARRSRA